MWPYRLIFFFLSLLILILLPLVPEDMAAEKLGFKGLYLGMTYEQVNFLPDRDPKTWESSNYDEAFGEKNNQGYLQYQNWNGIGCEGPTGKQFCHRVSSAHIEFFKGRVLLIDIMSLPFTADRIESELKDWLKFALKGLTEKYGPPQMLVSVESLNIFSFKSQHLIHLREWKRGQNSIFLSILEAGHHYYSIIRFADLKSQKEEQSKSKSKHEF
jgi:hypothetical protein